MKAHRKGKIDSKEFSRLRVVYKTNKIEIMGKRKSMKPYSIDGQEKYTESDFSYGSRKQSRARKDARDANRELKKQKRQELKRELEDEILKLYE